MTQEQNKYLFEEVCCGLDMYYAALKDFIEYIEDMSTRPFRNTIEFEDPYGNPHIYSIRLDEEDKNLWFQQIRATDANLFVKKNVRQTWEFKIGTMKNGSVGFIRRDQGVYNYFSGMALAYSNGYRSPITQVVFWEQGLLEHMKINAYNGRAYLQMSAHNGNNIYIDKLIYYTWKGIEPDKENISFKHLNGNPLDNSLDNLEIEERNNEPKIWSLMVVAVNIYTKEYYVYNSIRNACASMNLSRNTVSRYINTNKDLHGIRFMTIDRNDIYYELREYGVVVGSSYRINDLIQKYELLTTVKKIAHSLTNGGTTIVEDIHKVHKYELRRVCSDIDRVIGGEL